MKFRWVTLIALVLTGASGYTVWAAGDTGPEGGFYTQQQADKGARIFRNDCSGCHRVDREPPFLDPLVGDAFIQKWHSVADLYHKSRWTMPADRVLGLEVDAYLAITAYLLQENGFKPGRKPLVEDDQGMKAMVLFPQPEPIASSVMGAEAGLYTVAQAERGEAYFAGSCSLCHLAELPPAVAHGGGDYKPVDGVRMGSEMIKLPLSGMPPLLHRNNVAELYLKNKTSMPMEYPGALSDQAYLDITAYLLKLKGHPAGATELIEDIETMRAMTLPEPDFKPLFNGRDFTGLKFLLGNSCLPPPGCGSTKPGTTFSIEKGALHISGRPSGYAYTTEKYLNFTLRLEMRYLPYEGMRSDGDYYTNTGILMFVTEHQVWPKTLEVQGLYKIALSMLPIDSDAKFTTDYPARNRAMRPVGEWNALEIVSDAGQVRVSVNGQLVTTVTEHEFKQPGHIGFQSEGSEVLLRNIRLKPH